MKKHNIIFIFPVCRILNEEKRDHEQLQETWQMANDQFLESQTLMMMDLRRMESVLSAEQQRQIAGLLALSSLYCLKNFCWPC